MQRDKRPANELKQSTTEMMEDESNWICRVVASSSSVFSNPKFGISSRICMLYQFSTPSVSVSQAFRVHTDSRGASARITRRRTRSFGHEGERIHGGRSPDIGRGRNFSTRARRQVGSLGRGKIKVARERAGSGREICAARGGYARNEITAL